MPATKTVSPQEKLAREALERTYQSLLKIRESKTLTFAPTPLLRREIEVDGQLVPFDLRYYQRTGVYHLLVMKRFLLGDGTGLGKTIEMLAALAYLWSKETDNKVIVVTPKSALWQWAGEIQKFLTGVRAIVASGPTRREAYQAFVNAPTGPQAEKVVLLLNYAVLQRDWDEGGFQPLKANGKPDPKAPVLPGLLDGITAKIPNLVVAYDECTAFKNLNTKTAQTCRSLSLRATRCYALTATLLKNNLLEGFSIFKVIQHPNLPIFTTKTQFLEDFCVTKIQLVPGGRRIPIVVGYRNLDAFRDRIDRFFLGRPKHTVSDELPELITKEILCELSALEVAKYSEASNGILQLGDGEVKDYTENKAIAALIYCQEIANSLSLLRFEAGDEVYTSFTEDTPQYTVAALSAKEEMLLDLLRGELEGEKVIVYSRFEKFITRLTQLLRKEKIPSVRITGKENDKARRNAQAAFQDADGPIKVIFISDAGSEAINLQAASVMVFMDAPWSYGNYVQLLGRPIRIGSTHEHVVAYHLVAVQPGKTAKQRKTIDHHVLELLRGKKHLADTVLGEAAVGALDFKKERSVALDLVRRMQDTASP